MTETPATSDPGIEAPGADTYVSREIEAIPGVIKTCDEDFLVEEIPLYDPCGEGEHIYLFVEKRGLTTGALVDLIARHFGVSARNIGIAGHKDRHAITRQVISVHTPGKVPEDFPDLTHDDITLLWTDRHTNKLRLGHLRGNRFSIRIRGVTLSDVLRARRVIDRVHENGVPNFFGPQRFGALGNNHEVGILALSGDTKSAVDAYLLGRDPEREHTARWRRCYQEGNLPGAIQALPRAAGAERRVLGALADGDPPGRALKRASLPTRRFWANAFQSYVFNRLLCARIDSGALATLSPGDLAFRHDNGSVFAVDEATAESADTHERLERLIISASGPMWGGRMTRAGGMTDERECAALNEAGVSLEALATCRAVLGVDMPGLRRPLRVPMIDPVVEGGADEQGEYLRCAFELPRGAFATSVIREITKGLRPGDDAP